MKGWMDVLLCTVAYVHCCLMPLGLRQRQARVLEQNSSHVAASFHNELNISKTSFLPCVGFKSGLNVDGTAESVDSSRQTTVLYGVPVNVMTDIVNIQSERRKSNVGGFFDQRYAHIRSTSNGREGRGWGRGVRRNRCQPWSRRDEDGGM